MFIAPKQIENLVLFTKLDVVALMVADPPQCNSTSRENLPNPVKVLQLMNQWRYLKKIILDLECPKAVQNSGTLFGKAEGVEWWIESLRKSQGQNLRVCRPRGFWLRDSRDYIHHPTPKAFPCNVIVFMKYLHCLNPSLTIYLLYYKLVAPSIILTIRLQC